MASFSLPHMVRRQPIGHRLHQLAEQSAAILEERMAQAQFDGLQIADALLVPLPTDQGYESLGFPESFFLAFGRFEAFFLLSPATHSDWVI